ncbi:MAG: lysylphosphatidylglycerol synthase transmembrane domain-containing protein [Myxococcota bacterium]
MKSALRLGLRLVITGACFALWLSLTDLSLSELRDAVAGIAPTAFAAAIALSIVNFGVGAVRWRFALKAYGASAVPPLRTLFRLYWVGFFFNTFVPANVGGDLLRAHATRDAFEGRTGAWIVVAVERLFGLCGLVLLASALAPTIDGVELPLWLAPLGVGAALVAALGVGMLRRAASFAPGRLGTLLASIPRLASPRMLVGVLLCSIMTQATVALSAHMLIASLEPEVSVITSITFVPVALLTLYLPTIAGLGARETAFVVLFGTVGVSDASATAASLGLLIVQLVTALAGGLVLVATPKKDAPDADGAEPASGN